MNKRETIWNLSVEMPTFPPLDKDISCDTLVIGGGICGILTAYKLSERGIDTVVIEKDKIGKGITYGTTAFISASQDTPYHVLANDTTYEKAKTYLKANLDAVKEYTKLSETFDFDFSLVDAVCYSKDNNQEILKEKQFLKSCDYETILLDDIPLPIKISKALSFPDQGEMNPLKLIKHLASKLKIYEDTLAIEVKKNIVITKDYTVRAKNIVICTHFPVFNNLLYSMRMYQMRSYVIAIKYDKDIHGLYTDLEEGGLYFRKYKDYLIIGGNDIRTGLSNELNGVYQKMLAFAFDKLGAKDIEYKWANQDLITLDGLPYIGQISSCNKGIYIATGFNEWGMTGSMLSAMIIPDLILGTKNEYSELFKPSRKMKTSSLLNNVRELIKDELKFKKRRCTHEFCALNYNHDEKSYDCPCHGSRFTIDGKVINGPANKDLK